MPLYIGKQEGSIHSKYMQQKLGTFTSIKEKNFKTLTGNTWKNQVVKCSLQYLNTSTVVSSEGKKNSIGNKTSGFIFVFFLNFLFCIHVLNYKARVIKYFNASLVFIMLQLWSNELKKLKVKMGGGGEMSSCCDICQPKIYLHKWGMMFIMMMIMILMMIALELQQRRLWAANRSWEIWWMILLLPQSRSSSSSTEKNSSSSLVAIVANLERQWPHILGCSLFHHLFK